MIPIDEAYLHDEYARVIRMCKGTKVKPHECVRLFGKSVKSSSTEWLFSELPSAYTFALSIVEDLPAFEGDIFYHKFYGKCAASSPGRFKDAVISTLILSGFRRMPGIFSWTPPKKTTFPLDGENLPSPDGGSYSFYTNGKYFNYSNVEDRDKVSKAIDKFITKLLTGEV